MADEQLTRIENTLDILVKGQGALESKMDRLEGRMDRVEGRIDQFEGGLSGLRSEMNTRFDQMRDRMDVLHEELRDDIKALGEHDAPTRREVRQGFADLRERLNNRLIPVEAAVRHHTAKIKKLEKDRS